MFGYQVITRLVYILGATFFVAAVSYVVWYSLRQRAKLREAERLGAHPHSVGEGIVMALQQAEIDRRHAHPHA